MGVLGAGEIQPDPLRSKRDSCFYVYDGSRSVIVRILMQNVITDHVGSHCYRDNVSLSLCKQMCFIGRAVPEGYTIQKEFIIFIRTPRFF